MKQFALLLALILAFASPVFAKGGNKQGHGHKGAKLVKIVAKADANGNHKIDSDEIAALEQKLKPRALKKLDKNNSGHLEANEIAKLNKKLAKLDGANGKKDGKKGKKGEGKKGKKGKKDGKKGGKKKSK